MEPYEYLMKEDEDGQLYPTDVCSPLRPGECAIVTGYPTRCRYCYPEKCDQGCSGLQPVILAKCEMEPFAKKNHRAPKK